jgi:AraC-like DNA-binding protein
MFGVMPAFGQDVNAVHFERAWLDAPLPQANERTAQLCEAQCRDLLDRRRARTGWSARVRDELLRQPSAAPSMESVAERLHMTVRTLHRKLADEQTSFRALLDEVRGSLAEELLASPGLSVKEIAERLGYAEPSSFIHAFKRWKGVPPRAFR